MSGLALDDSQYLERGEHAYCLEHVAG
jgi:hypothetical protein